MLQDQVKRLHLQVMMKLRMRLIAQLAIAHNRVLKKQFAQVDITSMLTQTHIMNLTAIQMIQVYSTIVEQSQLALLVNIVQKLLKLNLK